jgi:hypothetical protein
VTDPSICVLMDRTESAAAWPARCSLYIYKAFIGFIRDDPTGRRTLMAR